MLVHVTESALDPEIAVMRVTPPVLLAHQQQPRADIGSASLPGTLLSTGDLFCLYFLNKL